MKRSWVLADGDNVVSKSGIPASSEAREAERRVPLSQADKEAIKGYMDKMGSVRSQLEDLEAEVKKK